MPSKIQLVNTDAFPDVTDMPDASHKFDKQSTAYSFTTSLFAVWSFARFGKLASSCFYFLGSSSFLDASTMRV